jgi:trimeric autotransporter adhesin
VKGRLASRSLLLLAALANLSSSTLFGQNFVGCVRGLVQDPGGAVIGDSKVTLTNEATGVARNTTSNALVEYNFAQLEPATYSVSVEAPGFKKLTRPGVIVGTAETVTVDLKMEIGQITESVQVTGDVALVHRTDSSL